MNCSGWDRTVKYNKMNQNIYLLKGYTGRAAHKGTHSNIYSFQVKKSLEIYPEIGHVLYIDAESQNNEKDLDLGSISNCHYLPFYQFLASQPARQQAHVDTKNDVAILPFSSGTTGPPKVLSMVASF